jgi:hypothetical protein
MSLIVIMPGGFHPFHAGHMSLYNSAKEAFPGAELYVAATNDMSERPFPFSIKEKLAKLAGVQPGHFIQVKSPFQAKEITQNFNPEQDVLVFVRSEKDKNESPKPGGMKKDGSPAYFQPLEGNKDKLQPFGKHAYFAYLPTVKFGPGITSATEIRNAWPTLNEKRKLAMVMSLYPVTQQKPQLAKNVVKLLDAGMSGQPLSESLDGKNIDKANQVASMLYAVKPELFKRFGDEYVMDKIEQCVAQCGPDSASAQIATEVVRSLIDELKEAIQQPQKQDDSGGYMKYFAKPKEPKPTPEKRFNSWDEYEQSKDVKQPQPELEEARIMDRDALINAFYVSPEGRKHRVAEKIPYYLLDKLVGLLTKKYNITMNDIEVRPADQSQYRRSTQLDEFAPDEGGGSRKFIPWTEFIEQLKQILHKDFNCVENIVKSTIKARFVPHDPMEFGPTMLYSYYETRAGGRNKGAISTRGSIQVGKYFTGGLFGQEEKRLLTSFNLLKGHPFERHFDLTFDNIYKIANIIQGNTEGALEFQPQQKVNEFAPSPEFNGGDDEGDKAPNYAYDDGMAKGFGLSDNMTLDRAMKINSWSGEHVPHFIAGFIEGRRAKIRMDKKQHGIVGKLMKDGSIKQKQLDEFAPNGFDGFEDDNRVPMHFVVEKELYNRRSKWKKSRDADGVILFATKQEAIQAAEKFNKLDPNREFAYGGTQMVHVDDDLDENTSGVSVKKWANQVRKEHGADVKFRNRKEGGGAVDSVIAKNSQGETVGVYNRKTGYPTVYEPKQGLEENFDAQEFHRHMEKLRAREELRKTDPMKALVGDLIDKENEKRTPAKKPEDDSININDPRHPSYGALHNPLSDLNEGSEIAQPGQLVSIIQAPRILDLLPGETFEVRSSNEQGVTLKHGMGTKFDNVIFPHGTYKIVKAQGMKENIGRRGILKGLGAAMAAGAAGKASAIAGAFPTPSHQAAMYKAAADSNRAQARADAAEKAKADAERLQKNTDQVDKEQRINHHKLDEFAPGNGDDGLPYAEYQVYQCNPEDQFDWIGGPLYQTDSMGMAHKYAYEKYVKHRPKAFMVWQERSQGSRGNYGVKGQSDHNEDDMTENSDYLDEK